MKVYHVMEIYEHPHLQWFGGIFSSYEKALKWVDHLIERAGRYPGNLKYAPVVGSSGRVNQFDRFSRNGVFISSIYILEVELDQGEFV